MDSIRYGHHRGLIIILALLLSGGAYTVWATDHLSVEAQAGVVLLQGAAGADIASLRTRGIGFWKRSDGHPAGIRARSGHRGADAEHR